MDEEAALWQAIHASPDDELTWLALADWLEECGQHGRAELVRLQHGAHSFPELNGEQRDERVRALLASGVLPCVPEVVNSIGMKLVLIPAGKFLMGAPAGEVDSLYEERPQHEVEITRPFYLGACPVTQEQWRAVMGTDPSYFCAAGGGKGKVKGLSTDDFPVEQVSWADVAAFLERLAALPEERKIGRKYRLPSEAEWEYACRGGATSYSTFCYGNSLSSTQANFHGNYPYGGAGKGPYLDRTSKVGSYAPNAFGLFDMHGNVWEWCADWYAADYYQVSPRRDPPGGSEGSFRVVRGGCWHFSGGFCRSADRRRHALGSRSYDVGFRVAAVPAEP
jgi:uncharacterized protein (TIGR02996 family)